MLAIIGAVFVFAFVGVTAFVVALDGADHTIKNGNNKDQVTCVYMYVCVFACVRVCACVFFEDEDKSHIAPDLLGLKSSYGSCRFNNERHYV